MPSTNSDQPSLLVLVGPTAVGKTQVAIELAERLPGEIISADSRYLYRGMDIGTAKPTPAERARVPHHLIDVTDPDRPWSLAQYHDAAVGLINEINRRGRLPMLVGGTGQYVKSVLEGWAIPRGAASSLIRAELAADAERDGPESLYRRLQEVDSAAAASIDPRNVRRVIRALEVVLTTGQPFSQQRQKTPPDYQAFILGLTMARDKLYERIDARVDQMLAQGLVGEVQALQARGYDWDLPAMSAIGYKQVGMYLRGEIELAEAIRLIKQATRVFVRRQGNWFKSNDPRIHWYNVQTLDLEQLAHEIQVFWGSTNP